MIKDYLNLLTQDNLFILSEKSVLFSHKVTSIKWITNAYYEFEASFEDNSNEKWYITFKFPKNIDEVMEALISLRVLKNKLDFCVEEQCLWIKNIDFEKLNLLIDIIYWKVNIKNTWILNKLINIINNESHIDINFIINILEIDENSLYFFNDMEILLNSLNIYEPTKIQWLINILWNNIIKHESHELLKQIKKEKNIYSDIKEESEILINNDTYKAIYYKNWNFKIWNYENKISNLETNDKNWVCFFFTILMKKQNLNILDYKGDFEKNRIFFHFKRICQISTKTFERDHPNRFNNFTKRNNIKLKVINDKYQGVTIQILSE